MSSPKSRNQGFEQNSVPTRINHTQLIASSSVLFLIIMAIFFFNFFTNSNLRSGDPLLQSSATFGGILLLFPLLFSIVKRSGLTRQPTRWFAFHVVASVIGFIFISIHVSAGRVFSIPGILYLILIFIIYQGVFFREFIFPKIFPTNLAPENIAFIFLKLRKVY